MTDALVHVPHPGGDLPAPVDGPVERVIVVGAGVAGLVVARALHLGGVEVVVVEGRDRIGGRTHTIDLGGASVDLGASWIHDGDGSPTLPLVDALGIERMPASTTAIALGAAVLDRADGTFPDADARDALSRAMAGIVLGAAGAEPGTSLQAALDALPPEIDDDVRPTLGGLLAMNEGKDADEVDLAAFAAIMFGEGAAHEDVMPRGGYRGLVEHLAGDLDIRTGQVVQRIVGDDGGVTVHTSTETFAGSHAVVTVPLGVLKAGAVAFDPPLPPGHVDAIARVGFGVLEKVALAYDRPVLDGHVTVVDPPRPGWQMVFDLATWYGVPVVVGLAAGEYGRRLAAMPEAERVAALHDVVRAIGGPDTPEPVASATTSWATDPFLLGCYANSAPGTDPVQHAADLTTLATPAGRVLFAGEHTCERGTSTVDSAWLSGVREAARLLQRLDVPL